MTKPPYDHNELTRIIAEGEDKWAHLYASGNHPDLDGTSYVPGTFDESTDHRNKRRKSSD